MRKLVVVFSALAIAGLAQAGEYHRLSQLRCSDCHTMHFSRQHAFDGNGADPGWVVHSATPNDSLLIEGGVNVTCLACHDDNAVAPDVLEANVGGYVPTGTRSAGFLNEAGTAEAYEGHSLDAAIRPPGLPATATWNALPVECENCHAVHGSRAYRNLGLGRVAVSQGFPSSGATSFNNVGPTYTFTATAGAVDPNYDVTIQTNAAGGPLNGTSVNTYETASIKFGKGLSNPTDPYFTGSVSPGASAKVPVVNGMNEYCAKCHGDFHGAGQTLGSVVGTTQHYIRHPTTGVVRAANQLFTDTPAAFTGVVGLDPTVVMDSADRDVVRAVFTAADKTTWEVGCLTCHKGHGNARPYGLILPDHRGTIADYENGDAVALPSGDYSVRNLCVTCHGMGRSF